MSKTGLQLVNIEFRVDFFIEAALASAGNRHVSKDGNLVAIAL